MENNNTVTKCRNIFTRLFSREKEPDTRLVREQDTVRQSVAEYYHIFR